ncbi:MAG: type II secretion system major pseudopilin GspG [Bdellovibrionales bacterium]|nr:type II secretion system major pseudopilin GspG [Bdellovibrionales bacterium]
MFPSELKSESSNSMFSISPSRLLRNSSGMTLLEIMIVLVILGGLIGVLATQVTSRLGKARVQEAKIQMSEIHKALDMYYTDCGHYPTAEAGLKALVEANSDCSNWGPDPYLKKTPKDPWGSEFIYEMQDGRPFIMSYGADQREQGTGLNADITSNDLDR